MTQQSLAACLLAALLFSTIPAVSQSSTTGAIRGRVTDETGAPVIGAKVTAASASQTASVTTDSSGSFSFISLAPDTYTIRVERGGYDPVADPGVSVFADQSSNVNVTLAKELKTIAVVRGRGSASLVHPGTTSDVYSVNSASQKAAQAVAGAGALNQAYGAIQSVPGVSLPSGQQGWYQSVYVRGGDFDQVAYEFDGVPVVRQSDLAPIVTLSSLGQQEVQVYTGGTPATSNSSGLAGYINQVIKTGTYPGYANASGALGGPAYYHKLSVEAGGSTPDRLFSYYVGILGANQDYRYLSQYNGIDDPQYSYPLYIPTGNAVYNVLDGTGGGPPNYGAYFSPGASYAQASNSDREAIANFHFGIPHRNDGSRDDVQLLYVTGDITTQFYSSANELGQAGVNAAIGYPIPWLDSLYYNGQLMQAPNASDVVYGPYPSSPAHTPFTGTVNPNERDANDNGFSIIKAQYQRNFNDHSYLRVLGYGQYTNWFINGPNSAQLTFGADLADYEVLGHIYGGNLIYANQFSSQHQLTAQLSYNTQKLQTYNAMFASIPNQNSVGATGLGTIVTNYVGNNGLCYNYQTGAQWSCFDANTNGTPGVGSQGGGSGLAGIPASQYGGVLEPGDCVAGGTCAGSAAATNGAHWITTEDGHSAQVDNVTPHFTALSLTDVYQPNDRLLVNFGARMDAFEYSLNNLEAGYPARQFWFNAYNNEYCGAPGQTPLWRWNTTTDTFGSCPAGYQPMTDPGVGFSNVNASTVTSWVFSPRAALTYTINTDTVLRASAGRYARATATSYQQYNTFQQDLPDFLAQFYALGYNTPDHAVYPDVSSNFDISLEKHIKGTQMSYKISPFYRSTSNQLQYLAIDPLGGTLAGVNVGTQHVSGVELSFQDGDFERDGFAAKLSYTYTNAHVHYNPVQNGVSVLSEINNGIQQYNSYTSACAGVTPSSKNWQACGAGLYAANAQQTFTNPNGNGGTVTVANPYYNNTIQPLLDTNAWYSPYDVIPSPFNAANGYETPNVVSLLLNYKHSKFAITPSVTYNDGSFYGSPLVEPGYVPQSCTANPAATPSTPGVSCSGAYTLPSGATASPGVVFLPDPYTHQFDSLGSLRQPSQLTLNLQMSYDVTPRATLTFAAMNLYNKCFQRGYAWDDPHVCTYSNLPSNILPPAGNFLTSPPSQLLYPYGPFFNITEVGYTAVTQPFQFAVNLDIKL